MSNCKVIALTNQKGGVGKTTTAVNLGVALAQQGKKVLLIDADAQANLTMSLGYSRPDDLPDTLSTIMQDIIDDKSVDVSRSILHHDEGVDLLPSNIELSGLEVRLINAISRESVLKTCINEVKKNYDTVLIDCMPSLGMLTINALAAADSVVIPTQPHYLSAKGLELLLRSVSKVKRQINPHLRIDGILMTMVMPRTNISKEITAIHHVGAEPELYTVEYNSAKNDVNEQVIKGNIAIIKHTDNGETQIETPEEGAVFEVYLKSAGSFDAAEETERDTLICDENGFAQTKDMPYGIYTVHQTSGWDGRELMKDFDVFICKDSQTYRYLINNAN